MTGGAKFSRHCQAIGRQQAGRIASSSRRHCPGGASVERVRETSAGLAWPGVRSIHHA